MRASQSALISLRIPCLSTMTHQQVRPHGESHVTHQMSPPASGTVHIQVR